MKVNCLDSRPGWFLTKSGTGLTSSHTMVRMRICAVDDCGKPVDARGYCQSHYRRLMNHGDPLGGKAKRPSGPCEVEGCAEPARRWGLCSAHSRALRTHGDPTVRVRRKRGTGYVRPDGYVIVGARHPLADSRGLVYVHRMVLYDAIGPGPHRCHWCGVRVQWCIGLGPGADGALVGDHLDFDPSNNVIENLVASCNPCNAKRHRQPLEGGGLPAG